MSNSVLSSMSTATISLFDAATATIGAVGKGINGATVGFSTFERFMVNLDVDHEKRTIIHRKMYDVELIETATADQTKRQLSLQKSMSDDPAYAKLYAENYAQLKSIFDKPTA